MKKMWGRKETSIHVLWSLLILCVGVHADLCTPPAREGSPYTLTQRVDDLTQFRWLTPWPSWPNGFIWSTCSINLSNNKPECENFRDANRFDFAVKENNGGYETTMTIKKVTRPRDETTFMWRDGNVGSSTEGRCELLVYALGSAPDCDPIQVTTTGGPATISWKCSVSGFYPQPVCEFIYSKDGGNYDNTVPSNDIIYKNLVSKGDYYSRDCSVAMPVSSLGPGDYKLKVYPNVVMQGQSVQGQSAQSSDLTLELPQVSLGTCPSGGVGVVNQGYVKKGTTSAECSCQVTNAGNPPGSAQWYNSNRKPVGNGGGSGIKTLPLVYNSNDPTPTYTCQGVSELTGQRNGVTYSPVYAYGPDSEKQISMSFLDKTKVITEFTQCKSDASFKVQCEVSNRSVKPKPTVKLTAGSGQVTVNFIQDSEVDNWYRFSYTVFPKIAGNLDLSCDMSNSIFPEFKATKTSSVLINAPPRSSPDLDVDGQSTTDNQRITATVGDSIAVKCSVQGGHPPKNDVTIKCSDFLDVSGVDETTQSLILTKEMNKKACTCSAKHETGCYDKTSSFTLDVQYSSTITSYKVKNKPSNLTVKKGQTVIFLCTATGNPLPNLSVKGQRSQTLIAIEIQEAGGSQFGSLEKAMGCMDTDNYTCIADNGVGSKVEKSIAVFVTCKPELLKIDPETKKFTVTNATDLEVEIEVAGYPEPKDFTLYRAANGNGRSKRAARAGMVEVDRSDYHASYSPGTPPLGTVRLVMSNVMDGGTGQYVLTIDNGVEGGLDFIFNVAVIAVSEDDPEEDNGPLIAGVTVAVVVVIAAVIVAVIVLKRRQRDAKQKSKDKMNINDKDGGDDMVMQEDNVLYYGSPPDEGGPKVTSRPAKANMNGPKHESYMDDVEMIENDIYGMDQNGTSKFDHGQGQEEEETYPGTAPVIPDKRSTPEVKPGKPAVISKKGKSLHNANTKLKDKRVAEPSPNDNSHTYTNHAMEPEDTDVSRSEDAHVYGNAGIFHHQRDPGQPEVPRGRHQLTYSTVEFVPNNGPDDNAHTTTTARPPNRFQVIDDGVSYSNIQFSSQSPPR